MGAFGRPISPNATHRIPHDPGLGPLHISLFRFAIPAQIQTDVRWYDVAEGLAGRIGCTCTTAGAAHKKT
ncbi:MAG: hypothetical protein ACI82F_002136 [Planctomycetota bacterium]|jgi:hypothetical protein